MPWTLKEARQKLDQLIRQAEREGPQIVTRRGREVAVVVSPTAFRELGGGRRDFKAFLRAGPDLDGLVIERSGDPAPTMDP